MHVNHHGNREPRELLGMKGPVPTEDYEIPFGVAAVVRPGTDLTVVAIHLAAKATMPAGRKAVGAGLKS